MASQGLKPRRGIARIVDRFPGRVEGRSACNHDEEADHAREDGADHDIDALVAQVLRPQALVDDV